MTWLDWRRFWRYQAHDDGPLFEPPPERRPKPGQPVALSVLHTLGTEEAAEARVLRREAIWGAFREAADRESVPLDRPSACSEQHGAVDLHWMKGESLEAARARARALDAEEAELLARAYARSAGDSLTREEIAQFAEEMATSSTERARSLLQRLWEARSGERLAELVRAYTETMDAALDAFIEEFEASKHREVRM
jgi:hypothetical protein